MATRGRTQPAPLGVVVVVGLLGTLCIAWGGWRVGALVDRAGHGRWLGGTPVLRSVPLPPRVVCFALWGIGLALLSLAWWLLHELAWRGALPGTARGAAAGRLPGRLRLRPGVVALIALIWALPLALGPPLGSSDVYSYVAHGELASRGLDPGRATPQALGPETPAFQSVDPIWRGVVSAYGPAATTLSEGAVRVAGHSVAGAVLVWRALAAAGVALAGLAVVVLARRVGRDPTDALVLAVAGPLTLVQLVGGVHNEAVMVGLLAAGLGVGLGGHGAPDACTASPSETTAASSALGSPRGEWRLLVGVVLCALGAAVKVPAFAGVVFLGWWGDGLPAPHIRRLLRTAMAAAVGLVTIEAVSAVSGAGWGWLQGVNAGSNVTSLLSVSTTIGLVLNWLAGQPRHSLHGPVAAIRALVLAAGAATAVALLWRTLRTLPAQALFALGLALTVVALAGASVQPWYLAWGVPALAVALAGRPARAWLVGAVAAAASTQPKGAGVVRNLGSFHGPALAGLVLAAAAAAVYARRARRRYLSRPPGRRRPPGLRPAPTPGRS